MTIKFKTDIIDWKEAQKQNPDLTYSDFIDNQLSSQTEEATKKQDVEVFTSDELMSKEAKIMNDKEHQKNNEKVQVIKSITERPNSFEFGYGKPRNSIKLYFSTTDDLREQLETIAKEAVIIQKNIESITTGLQEAKGRV